MKAPLVIALQTTLNSCMNWILLTARAKVTHFAAHCVKACFMLESNCIFSTEPQPILGNSFRPKFQPRTQKGAFLRPPAEIGISQTSCGVVAFPAAFATDGIKEHCRHNLYFDPRACPNKSLIVHVCKLFVVSLYSTHASNKAACSLLQLAAAALPAHAYR